MLSRTPTNEQIRAASELNEQIVKHITQIDTPRKKGITIYILKGKISSKSHDKVPDEAFIIAWLQPYDLEKGLNTHSWNCIFSRCINYVTGSKVQS